MVLLYDTTKMDKLAKKGVDFKILQIPPEEVLSYEDGLICNHEYTDMRYLDWSHWEPAYKIETKCLIEVEKTATTLEELEDLLDKKTDEIMTQTGEWDCIPAELGISSMVIALYAIGCFPMDSCSGKYWRQHPMPHVAFFSRQRKARKLVELISSSKEVRIINCEFEGYNGLVIYSGRALSLIEFSRTMHEQRALFEDNIRRKKKN